MNNRTSTTRIARTAAAAIAVSAALLAGCSGGNKDEASGGAAKGAETGELHVYTWSDYMAPEFIEAFEAKYGCKVVIDTYDSNGPCTRSSRRAAPDTTSSFRAPT
jgi:spermidine/putrescine transport system substrate-binding protein